MKFEPGDFKPPKYYVTLKDVQDLVFKLQTKNLLDINYINHWLKLKPGYLGDVNLGEAIAIRAIAYINKIHRENIRDFLSTFFNSIDKSDKTKLLIFLIMHFTALGRYTELFSLKPIITQDKIIELYNEMDSSC